MINRIINALRIRLHNRQIFNAIKMGGGKIGKHTQISILPNGTFRCGKNVVIHSEGIEAPLGSRIVVLPGATLEIGNNTGMSQVSLTCANHISIGQHCTIGAGVMLFDTNFHNTDWKTRGTTDDCITAKTSPIHIGDYVFIGARCIINKGVTIGSRSIIAAGSVVVKDIPDDCIAGGNPCRIIKSKINV